MNSLCFISDSGCSTLTWGRTPNEHPTPVKSVPHLTICDDWSFHQHWLYTEMYWNPLNCRRWSTLTLKTSQTEQTHSWQFWSRFNETLTWKKGFNLLISLCERKWTVARISELFLYFLQAEMFRTQQTHQKHKVYRWTNWGRASCQPADFYATSFRANQKNHFLNDKLVQLTFWIKRSS